MNVPSDLTILSPYLQKIQVEPLSVHVTHYDSLAWVFRLDIDEVYKSSQYPNHITDHVERLITHSLVPTNLLKLCAKPSELLISNWTYTQLYDLLLELAVDPEE